MLPRKLHSNLHGVAEATVALRIPDYPFLNNLLEKIDKPLAQTSVNISGRRTIDTISGIIEQFGAKRILIIDGGDLKNSKASKLIDATKDTINVLRP
ncbi:Sua5/YciO/YrdC/YwlC family protein [Candidatus Parcubacteria bacterium]|nr:Sua5/YciO/YrdC/YwlC family protein [Candidatus Parcubacteria bacterium]